MWLIHVDSLVSAPAHASLRLTCVALVHGLRMRPDIGLDRLSRQYIRAVEHDET